jgi:hypothetical protein
MNISRRDALKGLATVAGAVAALPAFARPLQRYRNICGVPLCVVPPPRNAAQARLSDPIMWSTRWHYQGIGDGWGVIRQCETGLTFVTFPGSRPSAWSVERVAYPIVGEGDTKEAAEAHDRRKVSQAAAQVATWAEEVGGGSLFLSFARRDDPDADPHLMRAADAPPFVVVDGSQGDEEEFWLVPQG